MGRNSFKKLAVVAVATLVLVVPTVAMAGPPSRMQQFLKDTKDIAQVGAVVAALTPGGQVAALVLQGISLGAAGLEIGFYSENKTVDTVAVGLSMLVRVKNPAVEDLAQRVAEEGARQLGLQVQRQLSAGNNTPRNTASCYVPGAGPVEPSLTMPNNASIARGNGRAGFARP
jgi:hypothetical protein